MITAHLWNPHTRNLQPFDEALLANGCTVVEPTQVLWLDLQSPTHEQEELVFRRFLAIHPLSLEDITRLRREPHAPPHFPKVEEFADYLFVIVNPITAAYLEHLRTSKGPNHFPRPFTQLSAVLTQNILITHHYEPLSAITEVQQFLERHQTNIERGPDYLFHLILDNTVDQYVPVLDFLDETLDNLELEVVQQPSPAVFLKLLHLKQEIVQLRKTFVFEREVLVRLTRGDFSLVDERETVYYRNVYDHVVRFTELIETSREMVADLMQSYLAATSNKLNEIMKVLAMISTVVLPMTLVAGIYGMNFKHMPELKEVWGYPGALILMVLMGMGSFLLFRWKRWL